MLLAINTHNSHTISFFDKNKVEKSTFVDLYIRDNTYICEIKPAFIV